MAPSLNGKIRAHIEENTKIDNNPAAVEAMPLDVALELDTDRGKARHRRRCCLWQTEFRRARNQ